MSDKNILINEEEEDSKEKKKIRKKKEVSKLVPSLRLKIKHPKLKLIKIHPYYVIIEKSNKIINLIKETEKKNIQKINLYHKLFSINDINAEINFKYFKYLKQKNNNDYIKKIKKYKFTLYNKDAISLGLFNSNYSPKKFTIEFFNELIKIDCDEDNNQIFNSLNIILENFNIFEYPLLFKLPVKYGNKELQLYSLLEDFISLFSKKEKINENLNKDDNNLTASDLDDSDNDNEEDYNFEKDDLTIIQTFYSKLPNIRNIQINQNIAKNIKNQKKIIEFQNEQKILILKCLQSYKILKEEKELNKLSDSEFISILEFIYYSLIMSLTKQNKYSKIIKTNFEHYSDMLYEKNKDEIINKSKWLKEQFSQNKLNKKDFVLNYFTKFSLINNPFQNFDFISYPNIMKSNFLLYNPEIYNEYKKLFKKIISSNLIKQIISLRSIFQNVKIPFDDEKFKDEILENTTYFPFEPLSLIGYINKRTSQINLCCFLKESVGENYLSFEKLIINFSILLISQLHETLMHYIRNLIYYNKRNINLVSGNHPKEDIELIKRVYIYSKYFKKLQSNKNIKLILKDIENEELENSDGGDFWEILISGSLIRSISINMAIKLFEDDYFNNTIIDSIKIWNNFNIKIPDFYIDKKIKKSSFLIKLYEIYKKHFPFYLGFAKGDIIGACRNFGGGAYFLERPTNNDSWPLGNKFFNK